MNISMRLDSFYVIKMINVFISWDFAGYLERCHQIDIDDSKSPMAKKSQNEIK